MKIDTSKLDEEKKRKILEKAVDKFNKSYIANKCGVSRETIYRYLTGKIQKIPDELINCVSNFLSIEEINDIIYGLQVSEVNENTAISVIVKMKRDPEFRAFFLSLMKQYLGEYINDASTAYVVTRDDVEKFLNYLKVSKSYKTFSMYRNYFMKILADLNYTLTAESLKDYILRETAISVGRASMLAKVLKLFIKEIVIPRNRSLGEELYNAFKIPESKQTNYRPVVLTIDVIKQIFNTIKDLGAKTFFLILAETGLRTGEVFSLKIDQVDLEHRIIHINKVSESKRAYITFLHESTARWLKEVYLPYRDEFIKRYEISVRKLTFANPLINVEEWKNKLFPFEEIDLRNIIKYAMRKTLGKEFRLYDLRSFFASYMLKQGVSPMIVNLLQGRTSPEQFKILENHYFVLSIEELRQIYDKHAPRLLE